MSLYDIHEIVFAQMIRGDFSQAKVLGNWNGGFTQKTTETTEGFEQSRTSKPVQPPWKANCKKLDVKSSGIERNDRLDQCREKSKNLEMMIKKKNRQLETGSKTSYNNL